MEAAEKSRQAGGAPPTDPRIDTLQFLKMFTEIFRQTGDEDPQPKLRVFAKNSSPDKAVRQYQDIRLALNASRPAANAE